VVSAFSRGNDNSHVIILRRIAWVVIFCTLAQARAADGPVLIYFDNDFLGPGQSNIQALIPLLRAPDVRLSGIGVVTGDAWLAEELAHTLRFLEIAGRADVPVFAGARMPLIRTQTEMKAWEMRYGRVPWKGAWNSPKVWSEEQAPGNAEVQVHIVREIDVPRFLATFASFASQ
jgi:inosine-uridine nucleoside N-ribohydrolase